MPWLEINLLLVTSSKTCLHQFDFYCNIYPFFLITYNKMKTHWIMQKFQQLTKLIIKPTYSNVPNNRETKSTLIVYKLEVRRQFSRLFQRQMILKRMCRCSIFPDKALTNGLFCLSGLVFFPWIMQFFMNCAIRCNLRSMVQNCTIMFYIRRPDFQMGVSSQIFPNIYCT